MGEKVNLSQRTLTSAISLYLDERAIVRKGDLLLQAKLEIPFRAVSAILRDKEEIHVVGPGDPITFRVQTGNAAYEYFMDQLIKRVVATS